MLILALPLAVLALRLVTLPRPDCAHLPVANAPRAASNDNRAFAATLRDGVLSLRIVARPVAWYPEGPQGCALRVHAFAEEGKSPRIPGPMIRVRAGTEVHVIVRNALGKALWMRGLQGPQRRRTRLGRDCAGDQPCVSIPRNRARGVVLLGW